MRRKFKRRPWTFEFGEIRTNEIGGDNLAFTREVYARIKEFLGSDRRFEALETAALPPCRRLNELEREALVASLRDLYNLIYGKSDDAKVVSMSLLCGLFANRFLRQEALSPASGIPEWLETLAAKMKEAPYFVQGLPIMRKLACRAREHINRSFKKYFDKTPTEFINAIRLERARFELLNSKEDISIIAQNVGFNNLSHFHRLFKKHYQRSPAQFRREQRQKVTFI